MNIKNKIVFDIQGDCDHYSKCGYDNWHNFLSDANMDNRILYDETLLKFTEKELENIWRKTHVL